MEKTDAYGFKRKQAYWEGRLQVLRKRMFFKPWFMGIPKGLGLLPTAQPSTCVLSDIRFVIGYE